MSTTEEWRPVAGFPDYEVSSFGRILSRKAWRGRPGPRVLQGSSNGTGYRKFQLFDAAGVVQQRYLHHLVAEAFIGPRPEGLELRHLDGDSLNNAAANLAYGTASENQRDRVRHGTHNWVSEAACRNGHERTPENTTYFPCRPGRRVCLDCRRPRDAARARQARIAASAAA